MHEVFQLLPRPLDSTASASTECQQILCTATKMKVSVMLLDKCVYLWFTG